MYAIFEKRYKDDFVKLADCILVIHEYQAQWFCITNQGYMYRKIEW